MRARQRYILREGMTSSFIEASHSGESREIRRRAVVVAVEAGVPHILPAAVPHMGGGGRSLLIFYASLDLKNMFAAFAKKILAPDSNVW